MGTTSVASESVLCVPDMIRRRAQAAPDRPAVVEGATTLTYGELLDRVDRLAGRLTELGAAPDQVIALYLSRGTDLVVAATAVLVAGGAYVALDVDEPVSRSRRLLADTRAGLVISTASGRDAVDVPGVQLVDVSANLPAAPAPGPRISPSSLAYVTYTSGSSGLPKGVMIEHRGLANLVAWYGEQYRVTPEDRLTQLARPSFDAFALEVWPCLALGAALHIVPAELVAAPQGLQTWLGESGVTVTFCPTPMAVELLNLPWPGPEGEKVSLRAMLTGGDRLGSHPASPPPFRLYNNYGPTECSVVATCAEVPADPATPGPPAIGLPIRGIETYVLDPTRSPVAEGEIGELYLGGVGVARGYLGSPELTTAAFLPDPFSRVPGATMYATGDLVRRSDDALLHFVSRVDGQVKIRGVRIEPAEVESALLRRPGVADAAVVKYQAADAEGDTLVGYVVTTTAVETGQLRAELAEELPAGLVPGVIVALDALPVTAHGKVDRATLAKRELPAPIEEAAVRLEGTVERLLSDLWSEVLNRQGIGRELNFFDIGGDSLRVIRLVNTARRRKVRIRPEDVYQYPVLRDLAAVIAEKSPRD